MKSAFLKNPWLKVAGVIGIALFLALMPIKEAHALFGIGSIVGGVIGYVAFIIIYIATSISSVAISIITYLIGVILQLSGNIVNTLAVQKGFTVTLAVANLGFVLAIIIIALATILHRETYGLKKTLWKLVAAAILVNFSLVIGGAIINFSNAFTNTFLSQLPGGGGQNGPMEFARELAGSFSPQRALLAFKPDSNDINSTGSGSAPTTASAGQTIASLIQPLISISAAITLLLAIVVTLALFLILLLIRYVYLAILLILMPFAWLLWLFPKTSGMWTKWWDNFFRWTFFAPIVVFFLWLAVATAQNMNGSSGVFSGDLSYLNGTSYQANSSNPVLAGLSDTFGDFIGVIATTYLQGILVVGLAVGGMVAANKFSIMGSGAALGAMKGGGKALGTWAAKTYPRTAANLAARAIQPRARVTPAGGVVTPATVMSKWRATAATRLRTAAAHPVLQTKSGLVASVYGGMKSGSGLFKGKQAQDWACEQCGHIERSMKKPTMNCPNPACPDPTHPNWKA